MLYVETEFINPSECGKRCGKCGCMCKLRKKCIYIPETREVVCHDLEFDILGSKLVDVTSDGVVYTVTYSGDRHGLSVDTIVNIFRGVFQYGITVADRNKVLVEHEMDSSSSDYTIKLKFMNAVERLN